VCRGGGDLLFVFVSWRMVFPPFAAVKHSVHSTQHCDNPCQDWETRQRGRRNREERGKGERAGWELDEVNSTGAIHRSSVVSVCSPAPNPAVSRSAVSSQHISTHHVFTPS
jgi:hypothetical protein